MKLLKIERSCGYFQAANNEYVPMNKLTKEDLLRLVDWTLANEGVSFDEMDEGNLQNQAHRIIYKSVHEKLDELASRRSEFTDESERLYLEEYDRYRSELAEVPGQSED